MHLRELVPSFAKDPRWLVFCAAGAWAVLWSAGCRLFESPEAAKKVESVLRAPQPSRESVAIQTVLVLVPDQQLKRLDEVWLHADEQVIDAATRRKLARNGFRAGVIGPAPPAGLAELLQVDSSPADSENPWQSVALDKSPTVTGHLRQLPPYKRVNIQASGIHELVPLFIGDDAGLTGGWFEQAQGLYALQWSPLPQGRIQVELTPELHHGRTTTQFAPGDGELWRMVPGQKKQVFEKLRIRVPLSAGQMLLVSGDPHGIGSLGHHFHTLPAAEGQQHKLVLIRLAQVPQEN